MVDARRALLATSAYPPLLRAIGRYIAPVYDYVLMTEPLSQAQLDAVGWAARQGVGDIGNQFHYYRLSADNRILWGGYDAVYRYGGPVGPTSTSTSRRSPSSPSTSSRRSRSSRASASPIAGAARSTRAAASRCSSARRSAAASRTRSATPGSASPRAGSARASALDLLDGRASEATALTMVRRRPLPFPPEPLRTGVIQLTRNRLAAADRDDGRRGLWLRTLDRLGLGFDS